MPIKSLEARRIYQNKYYWDKILWIREYKEKNPCIDCGNFYPYYVMDFDHKEGGKFKTIGKMRSYSDKRIQEEIDKCDLVCANCHRVRTYLRNQAPIA